MRTISTALISLMFILNTFTGRSQVDVSSFTTTGSGYSTAALTDYQTVGINPANLGWKRNDHSFNLGIGEIGFSIYSEPLKRTLVNDLFNDDVYFSAEEREEAARNFTESELIINGEGSGLGISFQDEKTGGFGFMIRENAFWSSNLNDQSAEFLFKGYNASYFDSLAVNANGDTVGYATEQLQLVSELFEGTRISLLWYREYNLSYGRSILNRENFTLFAGAGIKYLRGYGVFDYRYEDGELKAYSSLNPVFDVDYDTYSPSRIEGDDYQSVGDGFAFDLGLSMLIQKKLRIGMAVNNIGSITWDGNVYEGEDGLIENIETNGIDNYDIFEEGQNIAVENTNWGEWVGLEEKKVSLPGRFRTGAVYYLNQNVEFGGDVILSLSDKPGHYNKPVIGLGSRIYAVRWFRASAGVVTGGNFGISIPVGLSFIPVRNQHFTWELGLAINDITTYFQQENPTVSLALGLMRFSFWDIRKMSKNIETTD